MAVASAKLRASSGPTWADRLGRAGRQAAKPGPWNGSEPLGARQWPSAVGGPKKPALRLHAGSHAFFCLPKCRSRIQSASSLIRFSQSKKERIIPDSLPVLDSVQFASDRTRSALAGIGSVPLRPWRARAATYDTPPPLYGQNASDGTRRAAAGLPIAPSLLLPFDLAP